MAVTRVETNSGGFVGVGGDRFMTHVSVRVKQRWKKLTVWLEQDALETLTPGQAREVAHALLAAADEVEAAQDQREGDR